MSPCVTTISAGTTPTTVDKKGQISSGSLSLFGLLGCFDVSLRLEGVQILLSQFRRERDVQSDGRYNCLWLGSNPSLYVFLILENCEDGPFERMGIVITPLRWFCYIGMPTTHVQLNIAVIYRLNLMVIVKQRSI